MLDALLMVPREGGNAAVIMLVQMGLFVAIFYFLLIRPQSKEQKKRQEMIAAVQKGDEIVTNGGIVGKITGTSQHRVVIESAGSKIEIDRVGIARVLNGSDEAARK